MKLRTGMDLKQKYGLTELINAAGTFTPAGVSRSSSAIANAAAVALESNFIMDELQHTASEIIAGWSGAEAGAVTHCTAASITLSVAAAIAGGTQEAVAALPDTAGMSDRVVLPAGHSVFYGQAITQAVRLSGANPVLAGTEIECSLQELETELAKSGTGCLLLVSSRLTKGRPVDLKTAVNAAHRCGVPAIIDAAAQDMRLKDLLATGADLVLVSAQKYLTAPTAGVVVGKRKYVNCLRAHEKGIGRGMKASKEAICGVLAAIEQRENLDLDSWKREQSKKVAWLQKQLQQLPGLEVHIVQDPAGMPVSRLQLQVNEAAAGMNAAALANRLKSGTPSIWVIETAIDAGKIYLELVPLNQEELDLIAEVLKGLLEQP